MMMHLIGDDMMYGIHKLIALVSLRCIRFQFSISAVDGNSTAMGS